MTDFQRPAWSKPTLIKIDLYSGGTNKQVLEYGPGLYHVVFGTYNMVAETMSPVTAPQAANS